MAQRVILHRSTDYVSHIFVIRMWAIKDGGYTNSQFDELQRAIERDVVGWKVPDLMVEEWIAYWIDLLLYEHVFGAAKGPFPFARPTCLPWRGVGFKSPPREKKVQRHRGVDELQTWFSTPSNQTTINSSSFTRGGIQMGGGGRAGSLGEHTNTRIPSGLRAMSKEIKKKRDDHEDQDPEVKSENGSPGFTQSGLGIGGESNGSGFQIQNADISQGQRGSSMGQQGEFGVPEQGFKSEREIFRENVLEDNKELSRRAGRKASNTEKKEATAKAVLKTEHHQGGTKRKIKVEEEEDGDSRPVSKQRR
ncbi:hypothetical protein N431DRAFT_486186 [Stipitochalara longipes BDJ]|nr:hypothetical protein N431DRAFT_486186 [Stipitochalara longipes BDJ]